MNSRSHPAILGKGAWGPGVIQATKGCEELHRKLFSVGAAQKYPKNTLCLLPGLWVVVTEVGSGMQGSSRDVPSLGGSRSHSPASRGQGVTRDGMCHDVAESSNCPGAGLGLGGGKSNTRVTEVSPGHLDLPAPHGHRHVVWALPFPWELLGAAGHLSRCHQPQLLGGVTRWGTRRWCQELICTNNL